MNFRDRVEDIMISRFLIDSDKSISDESFNDIIGKINDLMYSMSSARHIQGFTPEDLYSFMFMQAHQVLRRGRYDNTREPNAFFKAVFTRMLTDIERRSETSRQMNDVDPIDMKLMRYFDNVDYDNLNWSEYCDDDLRNNK